MSRASAIRDELGRTVEEATYLAVGLGILAARELRRRRRRASAPPPPPPGARVVDELTNLAQPVAEELRDLAGALSRFARDALRHEDDRRGGGGPAAR